MNWIDFVVVLIILVFSIIGLSSGFIFSIFRIGSFFISIFVAVKFHPVVAKILLATNLDENIQKSIKGALMLQQKSAAPQLDSQIKEAAADSIVNRLQLPQFLKGEVLDNIPNPSKLIPVEQIIDTVSREITVVIINIISLVLLYIAIRIGLVFAKVILRGIAKLPVFKQVDKIGGFAFGAVEGLLYVYICMAILMLFNSAPKFKSIFEALNTSSIAKFFYQNNFIINWMFK